MNLRKHTASRILCLGLAAFLTGDVSFASFFGHKANRPKDVRNISERLADELSVNPEEVDLERYTFYRTTVALAPMQRNLPLYLTKKGQVSIPIYKGGSEYPWKIERFSIPKRRVGNDAAESLDDWIRQKRAKRLKPFGLDRWYNPNRPVEDKTGGDGLSKALGIKMTRIRDTTYIIEEPPCYLRVRYFSSFVQRSENNFYVKQGWEPRLWVNREMDMEISAVSAPTLEDLFALFSPSLIDSIQRASQKSEPDYSREEFLANLAILGIAAVVGDKVGDWLRNSSVDVGYSSTDPVTKVAQDRSDEDEKSEASVCSYDISKGSMDGVLVVKCDSGRTRAYKQNERGSWEVAGGIGAIPASNLFESIDDAAKTWCRCD